jgi:hypothetical protein
MCAAIVHADQPVFTPDDDTHDPLRFGIRSGINITDVADHPTDTKSRTTFCVGAVANYRLSRYFSMQIEAIAIDKGYRLPEFEVDTADIAVGKAEASISVVYIEFPIMAKFRLPLMGYVRPYILGGGFAGFAISDKITLSDIAQSFEYNLADRRSVDAGLTVGAGVDIKAGLRTVIFLEIRYEPSMTTVITSDDQTHRVFSFQAGWLF